MMAGGQYYTGHSAKVVAGSSKTDVVPFPYPIRKERHQQHCFGMTVVFIDLHV